MLALDHLIVAATSLDAGAHWLESRLQTRLAPGGQHLGWGTHNRLLQLGGGTYLELIAIDASQPAPATPRPFGLDDPQLRAAIAQHPRLIHYVLRTDRLDTLLPELRYDPGRIAAMNRGELKWRITLPDNGKPLAHGRLPTLIQWDVPESPAMRLPDEGVRLEGLQVRLPSDWISALPPLHDPRFLSAEESADGSPGLRAILSTPSGGFIDLVSP